MRNEDYGKCSGPLPGKNVTVVQTGEKTLFVTEAKTVDLQLSPSKHSLWCDCNVYNRAGSGRTLWATHIKVNGVESKKWHIVTCLYCYKVLRGVDVGVPQ